MDGFGKQARQRLRRRAGRRFGGGIDQVSHSFGLRQVELVIQKSAVGKLTGLRQAQAKLFTGFQAALQQHLQHHRAAMALQFQHVFAGIGMRCGEVERQALVDHAAVGIDEAGVGGMARLQRGAARQFA